MYPLVILLDVSCFFSYICSRCFVHNRFRFSFCQWSDVFFGGHFYFTGIHSLVRWKTTIWVVWLWDVQIVRYGPHVSTWIHGLDTATQYKNLCKLGKEPKDMQKQHYWQPFLSVGMKRVSCVVLQFIHLMDNFLALLKDVQASSRTPTNDKRTTHSCSTSITISAG